MPSRACRPTGSASLFRMLRDGVPWRQGVNRSMYAIVNIAGIQTKVSPDEVLNVALMSGEPGAKVKFDEVLLVGNGDKISVGQPTVKGASVSVEILAHLRGEKVKIFKFKRRREYRRRRGYRSELTRIRVTAISA